MGYLPYQLVSRISATNSTIRDAPVMPITLGYLAIYWQWPGAPYTTAVLYEKWTSRGDSGIPNIWDSTD